MAYLRQQSAQAGQLARSRERERQEAVAAGRQPARSSSAHARNLALAAFQVIIDRPQVDQFAIVHPLARLGKARAAALAGDLATARTAYQDFLTWWKDADPDRPVLVAAKAEYEQVK